MTRLRAALPAALALAAGAAACSGSEGSGSGEGTIAGDVFVVLETGEEIASAGRPVRLVPDAAGVDSALALVCDRRKAALDRLPSAADSGAARVEALGREASARAWAARDSILAARALRSAATGPDARFALERVPAGRYRLWADATVQGERWTWLLPVRLAGGDSVRVSLSNDNADEDPFNCQRDEAWWDQPK